MAKPRETDLQRLAREEAAFRERQLLLTVQDDRGPAIPPPPPQPLQASVLEDIRRVLAELARRQIEALKLYQPLPLQEAFHRSPAPERIVRGSNRAGKTLCTAAELARAVTGQDPHGKFPLRDGRAYAVGKDGRHCGEVLYRKLFKPGAFRIIKSPQTGEWRAFMPWHPEDAARRDESRPAPPLIPPRLVKETAWENKKASVPNIVRLTNGWELSFFSSLGKPPQGTDVDLALFDEEIIDPDWYPEIAARLLDRAGRFVWGATPQAGTEQLYELHEKAEELAGDPAGRVQEFVLTLADNPHLDEAQKKLLVEKYSSPEQYRVRILGEFAIISLRVFPEFSEGVHGVEAFEVPPDWTLYAAIDPGVQVCAVLFLGVRPPAGPVHEVHVFDELYLPRCTADLFGQRMGVKCTGRQFEAFLIDGHAGRVTEHSGRTVEDQYSAALKLAGVKSNRTGHGFQWGADDVAGGLLAMHAWLQITSEGRPVAVYHRGKVQHFPHEMARYKFKQQGGVITDKPNKKLDHSVDCFRYLAMHGCRYAAPRAGTNRKGYAVQAVEAKRAREKARRRAGSGGSGTGTSFGPAGRPAS